jgi:hypothetical protein
MNNIQKLAYSFTLHDIQMNKVPELSCQVLFHNTLKD